MIKSENDMTDEQSRLARLEEITKETRDDVREIKDTLRHREDLCMAHAETIAKHGERIVNVETEVNNLSSRLWYAIIGVLLALSGFILDFIKK